MKKELFFVLATGVLVIIGLWYVVMQPKTIAEFPTSATSTHGYKDLDIVLDGQSVTLANGYAETMVGNDSSVKMVTRYFGNEARGDLNADGKDDVAYLVTQDGGGTGTFYYIVVAVGSDMGYHGTNAIFLGDRIAPQSTEIREGKVLVNFADRKPEESFATLPSVGVSLSFLLRDGSLIGVEQTPLVVPVVATSSPKKSEVKKVGNTKNDSSCGILGGTWDAVHRECLGIDQKLCREIGGNWNECASACRNDPNAQVCTMQCVLVCEVP